MNKVKHINIVFLFTVLIYFGASIIFSSVPAIYENGPLSLLLSQVVLILPMLIYVIKQKINILSLIRFKPIRISNILLIILFTYLVMPVLSFINAVSMLFARNFIQDTVTDIVSGIPFVISLLLIAIIPSIFEESVYRGAFFNEYRNVNLRKGVLLSGLLFGLMHMNINQFMYAFVMGMIFALLIEATDTIVSSMIVHLLINGSSVFWLYVLPKIQKMLANFNNEEINDMLDTTATVSKDALRASLPSLAISALVSGFLAFIVYRFIAKREGRWEGIKENLAKKDNNRFMTIPLAIGILVCVAFMIFNEIA